MPISNPPLLGAAYEDLGERTEKLASVFTRTKDEHGNDVPGWIPPSDGGVDLGRALIRVFENMARHAVDRINRIPERSFLAFLDRIGIAPAGARAARVPLTFSLVARGDSEPTVPGQTRVGAKALPGDRRDVVFETERDLYTTRAKLVSVFVRQPDGDRLADCTACANGAQGSFFEAFDGGKAAPHELYLAAEDVFALPAGMLVCVTLDVDDVPKWKALHDATELPPLSPDSYYGYHPPFAPLVRWTYWNGTAWSKLPLEPAPATDVKFKIPADMTASLINGRNARWIRAELLAWPLAGVPKLTGIVASATQTRTNIPPTAAMANNQAIDLSLDFFPFGETPRLNDRLTLACAGLLDRPGATVTVNVSLNPGTKALKASDAPVLTWEISTGSGWKILPPAALPSSATANNVLCTRSFTVPPEAAAVMLGNTKAVWLRVRLSAGSFGKGLSVDYSSGAAVISDDGYRPPIVQSISFSSTETVENKSPLCTTADDLSLVDRSSQAPFVPFAPFTRAGTPVPTLFLGFDRAFSPRDTFVYFQVAPLNPLSAAKEASAAASGNVAWEYWSSEGMWKPLVGEDETRAFSASGLLGFVAPADLGQCSLFAQNLFWIRACYQLPAELAASAPASPRIGRVLTNTIWARDAIARSNEILGSADGNTEQSFSLVAKPVLSGQRIEVREPSAPQGVEKAQIMLQEGKDAIAGEADPRHPNEVWVRWHEVENFYASGPRDRHYTFDRETGTVRFGDGKRGMVPPRGSRNVRAAAYAIGGGADGNRPVGTIDQLKTTVPYVDGVINHERATGGANADAAADLMSWGPNTLRHGYRAVTAQDFEDLALEASPAVARARVLTPEFDAIKAADDPLNSTPSDPKPGALVLLLATNGPELPPAATTGLLRDVSEYLRARSSPSVALRLAGPIWIEVSVGALDIRASSPIGMEALRDRIERALHAFFHPITGNTDGTGWPFGAFPHASDVYRLVMSIPGVDRLGALAWTMLTPDGKAPPADELMRARVLIYPGRQTVRVLSAGGM